MKRFSQGFTLVEVMIALAVFTVSIGGLIIASSGAIQNASHIKEQTYGRWVNQNVLTELRLHHELPKQGEKTINYEYNNQQWSVVVNVSNVDMELLGPFLRRVELNAYDGHSEIARDTLIAILGEAGE